MAHHGHESSATLEREVRAQRAEISETLTEIRGRLSPGQLLDEVLRNTGTRQNVSRIGSVMVRNPLPVMLIGVGVLWLALSNDRPPRPTDSWRTRRPGRPIEGNTLMAVSRENLTEAGEHEVVRSLEENLHEEEAMAAWLGQHLPEVTRQYLHREAAGQSAKV